MADVSLGEAVAAGSTMLAGVWAVAKAMITPHVEKITEHGKQIKALEDKSAAYVTRADLERTETTVIDAVNKSIDRVATQIGERIETMNRATELQIQQVAKVAETTSKRLDEAQQEELRRLRSEHRSAG